jgi:hypothetical protein
MAVLKEVAVIAQAEIVSQIPAYAQQDHRAVKIKTLHAKIGELTLENDEPASGRVKFCRLTGRACATAAFGLMMLISVRL